MIKRANKACRFFPCHKGLEDCTFCYCPFYPCLNRRRGNYIYSPKLKENIWSCQDCNWIHKKKVVDSIFALIPRRNPRALARGMNAHCFLLGREPRPLGRGAPLKSGYRPEQINSQRLPAQAVKTGIIILGHGSKLHEANKLLSEVARIIKKKKKYSIIEPSYLQFHHPDLSGSIKKVIEKGCKKVVIVPFFLFNGNHVKRDIPKAIKKAILKYPDVKFIFTKSLGEDEKISEIVFNSINEAIKECM